jgi:hypothetical protein
MARCDEGYRCQVCGGDVEAITDSALYLRYILGEIPLEQLHQWPECHLRCLPALAQYICSPSFEPVFDSSPFQKSTLPADYVQAEEARITAGWERLRAIPTLGLSVPEYPLHIHPEADADSPLR